MSDLFFQLGRRLGHAAIPVARKTRWAWRLFAGSEPESLQAEAEMGAAMAREVAVWEGATADDRRRLEEISERLRARLRSPARVFQVQVVNTGGAAAFSLPGGYIFLDIALIDLSGRDPNELAFVVAHEMAHVIRRHALDRWVAGAGIQVMATLISRGALGAWWRENGSRLLRNAYDRQQEYEADAFGARLAGAAGFDPAGAVRLLGRLEGLRQRPGLLGEHYASHPPEADRIARLQKNELMRPGNSAG
jgi:predicted Zn-dependent protease